MKLKHIFEVRYASSGIPSDWKIPEWFSDMMDEFYYSAGDRIPETYADYLYHFRNLFSVIYSDMERYDDDYRDQMDYELDGPMDSTAAYRRIIKDLATELKPTLSKAQQSSEWEYAQQFFIYRFDPQE